MRNPRKIFFLSLGSDSVIFKRWDTGVKYKYRRYLLLNTLLSYSQAVSNTLSLSFIAFPKDLERLTLRSIPDRLLPAFQVKHGSNRWDWGVPKPE